LAAAAGDEPGPPAPRKRRTNAPQLLRRKAKAKPASEPDPTEGGEPAEEGAEGAEGVDPADLAEFLPEGEGAPGKADFLVTYFKDLTRLSVLSPAAEYELARRIGIMEEVLWVQLLSLAPLTPHIIELVETDLGKPVPEFRAVQKAASSLCEEGKMAGKPLAQVAGPAAAKLRQVDLDRLFVTSALEEIKHLDQEWKRGSVPAVLAAMTPDITWDVWHNYVQGTSVIAQLIGRAKEDFVKANLRLVVSIARRFNYGRMPLADLIQEGNMGLIKAVERFDYRRGYRFSTYASWWIRHAISRGLADKSRVVRLPVHTLAEVHSVMRAKRRLSREFGRQPTNAELASVTNIRIDKIEKMDSYLVEDAVSLDREVSDNDKRCFVDFLQDDTAIYSMSERLISEAMLSEVQQLLTSLSPMEADILRLRFGIDSDQELTLKEIGEKYNLSRERIRQLQEQALSRMRRSLARKDLI
jgi:RNA polymerase primary sigma factor